MKKIIFFMTTLLLSLFVFVACEDYDHANGETQSESEMVGIPDSIREKIKQQDTVLTACSEKIDSLVQMQNEMNRNISSLQEQVNNLKEPSSIWNILIIVSFFVSVIALVLWVILNKKLFDEKSIKEFVFKSRRFNEIKQDVKKLENEFRGRPKNRTLDMSSGHSDLNLKFSELQHQIDELKKQYKGTPMVKGENHSDGLNKVLYVNAVDDLYFMQTTPNLQDDSIFKINSISPTRGNFGIINIKKIQQNNQLNDVVEVVHSSCQLAEAKDCKVVEEGTCELIDGYWKVTRKLKIKIW